MRGDKPCGQQHNHRRLVAMQPFGRDNQNRKHDRQQRGPEIRHQFCRDPRQRRQDREQHHNHQKRPRVADETAQGEREDKHAHQCLNGNDRPSGQCRVQRKNGEAVEDRPVPTQVPLDHL
jgi:hypothetical protein